MAKISPQAQAIIDQALRNVSPAPLLNRPYYNPELTAQYGLQTYNNDQFYKLRWACINSEIKQVIPESLLRANPAITYEVCDEVLDIATEEMKKNPTDVANPRHLLAPFHVAAKVRDIPVVEGNEATRAYNMANAYGRAGVQKGIAQSKAPGRPEITTTVSSYDGKQPVTTEIKVLVPKGMARDAAFTEGVAFSIFTGNVHGGISSLSGSIRANDIYINDTRACVEDGDIDRLDCRITAGSKYAHKRLDNSIPIKR